MEKLKIQFINDPRIYQGTYMEIIEQMKYVAFGWQDKSDEEYIDNMAKNIKMLIGIAIDVTAKTIEEKAQKFIHGLLTYGGATEVK